MDQPNGVHKGVSAFQAIGFVWDVLIMIAAPTIIFAFAGRWLDGKLHTTPVFTLVLFIPALALAFVLILRRARQLQNEQRERKP